MFKNKRKREKRENMELDITSLLDILVILLVFLLKSYSASELRLDVAKGIRLPSSDSKTMGNHALIIQMNQKRHIWLNNKLLDESGNLDKLAQELSKYKDDKEKKEFVNIVLDQELEYAQIKELMTLIASNGYSKLKLIVKGDY